MVHIASFGFVSASKIEKNFRLSHNSMKLFWVTRFRETNLTAQSVSLSEI